VKMHVKTAVLLALFWLAIGTAGRAQEKPAAPVQPKPEASGERLVPVKIQVVISRYQGDKRVSSLPHTVSVNAPVGRQGKGNLRMGSKIPVLMMAAPRVDGKEIKDIPVGGPVNYHDVGTNIDCFVRALDDTRFALDITVEDTSVYGDEAGKNTLQPSFRSFRASESMILRDGQNAQFTTATDKVTGEQTRVEVTLTIVK
jgi:hypothetical protein